jgi:DivIVA domain-containing protein
MPPELTAQAIRAVRFRLAFRGYRMSEVDAFLERMARYVGYLAEDNRRLEEAGKQGRFRLGMPTHPDAVSPDRVRSVTFRLQFRGYQPRDVDRYLDDLTHGLERLLRENTRLRS